MKAVARGPGVSAVGAEGGGEGDAGWLSVAEGILAIGIGLIEECLSSCLLW